MTSAQHSSRETQGAAPSAELPVSLIIPVRNEEQTLGRLLASIDAQTARPAQVVLVDGGSSDRTVELLQEQARQDPRWTVVVADGPATPGRGRNLGAAAARHEWLAMTDAGITLEPTWLEQLWRAHEREPDARVVYGNYEFDVRSFFERCAAIAYCDPKRETPSGPCRGPAVVSVLVHRWAFSAVGGFIDSRSGEDEVFVRAVEQMALPVAWAPDATVSWRLRPDLASTVERFRLYSYHYVLAGEEAHWHHRLARSYVPVGLSLVLAGVHSPRWLAVAAAAVAGRVAVRLRRHRGDVPASQLVRPDVVGLVALVMLATDASTAVGWWQAVRSRRREAQAALPAA